MQQPARCVSCSDFVFSPKPPTAFGLPIAGDSSGRATSATLVGADGAGKTTLLWQFAVNAARSRLNVLFVAKRSKAFDRPPMLFASPTSASGNTKQFEWLGGAGAEAPAAESSWQDALRRIKVRYLDTYADLRRYFGFAHMHPGPPPDVVVVDDYHSYFDVGDAQSLDGRPATDGEANLDLIGTTALVAEAGHFWAFKRRQRDEATPKQQSASVEKEGGQTVTSCAESESGKKTTKPNICQHIVAPLTGPSADCSPTLLLCGVSADALHQNHTLQAALRYFTTKQFRLQLATATKDKHGSSERVVQQVQLRTQEASSCFSEATSADQPDNPRSEAHSQPALPTAPVLHLQLLASGKVMLGSN